MNEVHVQVRGPEGVRGSTQFRTTRKGGDELLKRIEGKAELKGLLDGIELEPSEPAIRDETGGPPLNLAEGDAKRPKA